MLWLVLHVVAGVAIIIITHCIVFRGIFIFRDEMIAVENWVIFW